MSTPLPEVEEMEEMLSEALALEADQENPYPGSTYVAGVHAALAWVLGEADEPPLEVRVV